MEKRRFSRIPFHAPVSMSSRGRTYRGEVENVSHGGMFVRTYDDLDSGEQVLVTVNFHEGDSQLTVTMPGTVARQTRDGVAVQSPYIDTHSLIQFEYMMASNSSHQERLMTDFIDYFTAQQERHLM